jgi:hypothetical protein
MRQNPFFSLIALSILLAAGRITPQTFEVIALDGSAKAQRVQKKEWDKLSIGSQLRDNDIIESFFQTKCVLRFGKGNIVIIGSNSKVLLNIRERESAPGSVFSDVNLTLFSGACFVKAIAQAHIGVYTSNAMGETEDGSFSTVVESRTGETGFQTLGGKIKTRNIAQKEGIDLTSGQTTMILPSKEPTAPLYITFRHVSVLKHFFGDEYIQSELDAAGIKPTEDRTSRSSTLLSDALLNSPYGNNQELSTYKIPFSLNKIYGAIIDDRKKNAHGFNPIKKPDVRRNRGMNLEQRSVLTMVNGDVFPIIKIIPSYSSASFDAGLRLPLASNYTKSFSMYGFSSFSGVLDKIDHLSWTPPDAPFLITLGSQNDLTIGSGNVVGGFCNTDPYALFQPLGFYGEFAKNDFGAQVFLSDLSRFSIGGIYCEYRPTVYCFGAGYFFDAQQFPKASPEENMRFKVRPDSVTTTLDSMSLNAHIYEINFSWNALLTEEIQLSLGVDFAQKLKSNTTDGFIFNIPDMTFAWNRMQIRGGFTSESGRLINRQFNSYYMKNRWRVGNASQGDTLSTLNTILSDKRSCQGLHVTFTRNFYKGLEIAFAFRQNFREKHTFSTDTIVSSPGTDLEISLHVNDSLYKFIRFGEFFVRQEHSGLYPPHSSLFSSWEFSLGVSVFTKPLFGGVSMDGSISLGFLDMNFDNRISSGDAMWEFSLGFSRGF